MDVEKVLRGLGIKGRVLFKPDVYTRYFLFTFLFFSWKTFLSSFSRCGIFAKGEYNIRPSLYITYEVKVDEDGRVESGPFDQRKADARAAALAWSNIQFSRQERADAQ